MPRKKTELNNTASYHISARSINKEWFLDLNEVWEVMEDYLYLLSYGFKVQIFSFVLMSNHFHLIAKFPSANMSLAMQYFMRETSKNISRKAGRINQTYGSRYFKSSLNSWHYYSHAYKYVYRNPVEAELSQRVQDYKYSTLNGLLGKSNLLIPIIEDGMLFGNIESTLSWLNKKPMSEHTLLIKKALRKPEFKIPINRKSRKRHCLENDAY